MIIPNVPFILDKEQKYLSCQGPPSVIMVYKFFKPNQKLTFKELYNRMNYQSGKWFFETYITRFFFEQKVPVIYSTNRDIKEVTNDPIAFNNLTRLDHKDPKNLEAVNVKEYDKSVAFVKSNNLYQLRQINIDNLTLQISKNKLIIATVNRNKLEKKLGYFPHFTVIKGFDKNNFICNDAYLGENIKIPFSEFKETLRLQDNKIDYDMVIVG